MFFKKYIILFIYLFLAVLGLCCYKGFSLVAASSGYSLVAVHGLLLLRNTDCGAHGRSSCGPRALEHRLSSCGAWA